MNNQKKYLIIVLCLLLAACTVAGEGKQVKFEDDVLSLSDEEPLPEPPRPPERARKDQEVHYMNSNTTKPAFNVSIHEVDFSNFEIVDAYYEENDSEGEHLEENENATSTQSSDVSQKRSQSEQSFSGDITTIVLSTEREDGGWTTSPNEEDTTYETSQTSGAKTDYQTGGTQEFEDKTTIYFNSSPHVTTRDFSPTDNDGTMSPNEEDTTYETSLTSRAKTNYQTGETQELDDTTTIYVNTSPHVTASDFYHTDDQSISEWPDDFDTTDSTDRTDKPTTAAQETEETDVSDYAEVTTGAHRLSTQTQKSTLSDVTTKTDDNSTDFDTGTTPYDEGKPRGSSHQGTIIAVSICVAAVVVLAVVLGLWYYNVRRLRPRDRPILSEEDGYLTFNVHYYRDENEVPRQ